ncbi:hypothetical protein GLU26_00610 [Nanohaloarchaea archaeon]|nr:hypothetical protein [Candidatus Nanohaloarchaea archaeon]
MSSKNNYLLKMVPYIPESQNFLLKRTGGDKAGCRYEFPEKEITKHIEDVKPLASKTLENITNISSKPVKTGESFENPQDGTNNNVVPVLLVLDEENVEHIPGGFDSVDRSQIKSKNLSMLEIKTIKKLGIEM